MRYAIIALAALLPALALAQPALTFLDRSGTITLGGTAQVLMPANPSRHGCIAQNNSANDLWINDAGTASAGGSSFRMAAGAQYLCAGNAGPTLTTGAVLSIFGATTAQAFAAREW